ncbi:predicted protein [Chaetomium globosum CBS 148.51]|uniref:Uncharacterized protein n=1 Tax=Chaetomium globosum (strain ATCC 6205 / CBS 148.51 / DSM 1962 / NBRC 6347 / NRRL 1970) TaxID=306901 RepID=Q2GUS7_CHAGB|nr:uncharacterized protein CHGG_08277 [Chaetomium globosum CBS 148.51]EAQ87024.1 predicted protein [Chaetomium globosum CBS 148.51]
MPYGELNRVPDWIYTCCRARGGWSTGWTDYVSGTLVRRLFSGLFRLKENVGTYIYHCRFSRQIPSAGMTSPCNPPSGMQPVVQARATVGI